MKIRFACIAKSYVFFFGLLCATIGSAATPSPTTAPPQSGPLLRARSNLEQIFTTKKGRAYRIVVSAPKGPEPASGFPVIYVLDGDAWFGTAVEIAKMREYEKLAPTVIVGVASPKHFFFEPSRSLDFTPPGSADPDFDPSELGGADDFLSFLNSTLKPWLRAKYHVDPARQILFGHSLGALFALHVLFKAPESFNIYLVASPYLRFSDNLVLKEEAAFEANPTREKVRVLVTQGSLESHSSPALVDDYRRYYTEHPESHPGQTVDESIDELFKDAGDYDKIGASRELVDRLAHRGVKASFIEFDGEEHMSAAISALNRGIPFALRPPQ